jgi:hypothetical protein
MERLRLLAPMAATLLSGCCMFMPCHPGLRAYGTVRQTGTGAPLVGARISVFGSAFTTTPSGCFKFTLPDGSPFELSVTHAGDEPVTVPSRTGFFHVAVALAPEGADDASTVSWVESTERDYLAAPDCP